MNNFHPQKRKTTKGNPKFIHPCSMIVAVKIGSTMSTKEGKLVRTEKTGKQF